MRGRHTERLTVCAFMLCAYALCAYALCACLSPALAKEITPPKEISQAQAEKWLAPGREAAQRGEYSRARKLTGNALSRASQELPADHWARAYLLNDLARWKSSDGEVAPALADAESALEIARRVFASEPARVAYFAQDVGVLRFQLGRCAEADAVLSETLAGLPAASGTPAQSALREQIATASARVAWSRGDLERARRVATAIPAPLLIAQIDIDAGRLAGARAELDRYRAQNELRADEESWPADYTQAELAYALGVGDLQPALARAQRLARTATGADPTADAAARHRVGQVLALLGRFAEAERELSAAVQILEGRRGEASPAVASIHHDLAWTYRSVSDYPRSEFHFERALAAADRCSGPNDSMPALMLRERAMLRIEQGKVSQALADIGEAARKAARVSGDTRVLRGLLVAARAFALDRLGDAAGAESAMREATQLIAQAEGSKSLNLPLGYVELADLALRRKGLNDARRQASAALAILEERGTQSVWGTGAALSIRGAASAAAKAPAAFWSDAERFVAVTERGLAPTGAPGSANQSEIAQARRQTERLLDAMPARDASHLTLTARLMQLPHISDATASLQVSALESQNLPAAVRALVRQRGELLGRAQALRSSLLLAQQRGTPIEGAAVAALRKVGEELGKTDAALLRASPSVAGQLLQHAVDPSEVQRHLAQAEGVLMQVLTDRTAHALLITRESVVHRSVAMPRQQIRADVRHLRRALDLSLPASERVAFDAARAHALYSSSVGLFRRELMGRERLVVIADDALQSLPWSVLVDELDPSGAARSFLVNRMSIATVPSLQSFVALRAAPARAAARRPYVAFADPRMERFRAENDTTLRGREQQAALDLLAELPALPESAAEVQKMAQVLGAGAREIYIGSKATEKAVRALDLSQFRVVSFATHGLMAGEIPGLSEPALVLTRQARVVDEGDDGLLTASEIAHLSLRADLVILSACNTGRINARAGVTGISGLARGFFAAGARSLLVSHWAVASESTAFLLGKAVERMAADHALGAADALRQAMLWMKGGGAGPVFANPEFWGAFSVVGASA